MRTVGIHHAGMVRQTISIARRLETLEEEQDKALMVVDLRKKAGMKNQ